MQPDFYESIQASPKVSAFVRRYMYADSQQFIDTRIKPAPTGCCYMGHIFRGQVWSSVDGQIDRSQSGFHLSCQVDHRDFEIGYKGKVGHIMAELMPTALFRLFGLSAGSLSHLAVDWIGTLKDGAAQPLITRLSKANIQDERVKAFDDIFCELAKNAGETVPHIDDAVLLIETEEGHVSISIVCDQLGVNERSFSRQFHKVVGISPKFFARTVQLNSVVKRMMSKDEKTLTNLAIECGFYDQSHFIKTMHEFFEQGPTEFLSGENPMYQAFVGKFASGPK